MNIYAITRIDFDNLENREPESEELIGYVDANNESEVKKFIATNLVSPEKIYKGWNKLLYPQFKITKLQKLNH